MPVLTGERTTEDKRILNDIIVLYYIYEKQILNKYLKRKHTCAKQGQHFNTIQIPQLVMAPVD